MVDPGRGLGGDDVGLHDLLPAGADHLAGGQQRRQHEGGRVVVQIEDVEERAVGQRRLRGRRLVAFHPEHGRHGLAAHRSHVALDGPRDRLLQGGQADTDRVENLELRVLDRSLRDVAELRRVDELRYLSRRSDRIARLCSGHVSVLCCSALQCAAMNSKTVRFQISGCSQ